MNQVTTIQQLGEKDFKMTIRVVTSIHCHTPQSIIFLQSVLPLLLALFLLFVPF
jgi:hypothetical protein